MCRLPNIALEMLVVCRREFVNAFFVVLYCTCSSAAERVTVDSTVTVCALFGMC